MDNALAIGCMVFIDKECILYDYIPATDKHILYTLKSGVNERSELEADSPGVMINALAKYRGNRGIDQLIGWLSKFPAA